MSSRHLYAHEVAVLKPGWEESGTPVSHSPPGVAVARVGKRAFRKLQHAQSLALLSPTVEPLPRGSSFVLGEPGLALRVRQARDFYNELRLTSHPWAGIEADQAKKICFQRGGPPGWYIIPEGLIRLSGPSLAKEFAVIHDLLSALTRPVAPAPRDRKSVV